MASPVKAKTKTKTKAKAPAGEPKWLREPEAPRHEIRYKPPSNTEALAGVLVSSAGAVTAGAGFYGRVLHPAPPSYAVALLVAGLVAFAVGLFISSRAPNDVRIGDAGIAVETPKGLERIGWYEVDTVRLDGGALTFRTATGRTAMISSA